MGKSSIINLIFGEEFLLYLIFCIILMICELKYGEKFGIRIYFKDCVGESGEFIY